MGWILAAIARLKGAYDWATFLDALRAVLETKFGLTVVSGLVTALTGAFTDASGYQITLMGVGTFLGLNAFFIHQRLRIRPAPMALSPVVSMSQEGVFPAKYIQISVRAAAGNLVQCQVMLTKVARMEGDKVLVVYDHPQNAAWSGTADRVIDINDGQEQRANLFSVSRVGTARAWNLVPRTAHADARLQLTTTDPATYRINIQASSSNTSPEEMSFLLMWGGNFEDVHVLEEKS